MLKGIRSFGDASQEARKAGASVGQQVTYGGLTAGKNLILEKTIDGLVGTYGKGLADKAIKESKSVKLGFQITLGRQRCVAKTSDYRETYRVLKLGGTFCGCFYIQGQNRRTDWFIRKLYQPKGFFTPPYETLASLQQRLEGMYSEAEVSAVKGKSTAIARSHSSSTAALRGILETHTAEA